MKRNIYCIKNLILGLTLMVSPFLSFGHNPLSAKYHLEVGENASLLTINLSQDGVNYLMSKKLGKEKLQSFTSIELEQWVVDYIKSNFSLSVDNKDILLEKGGVKLGSHQTDLKFVLPSLPKSTKKLAISIPAFNENDNHQTIFSYNILGKSDYVILSSQNNYQFTILDAGSGFSSTWFALIVIGLLSIFVVAFYAKKRNKTQVKFSMTSA